MLAIVALIFELILLAVIKSSGVIQVSNLTATILILIFSLCLLGSINSNKRLKGLYSQSLSYGYLLRVAILYFDIFGQKIYTLPNTVGDATVFYREASFRAEAITVGMTTLPGTRGNYPNMMARIFAIIGTNRLYGQFLSMLCSIVALVFFAYALSKTEISDQTKKRIYRILCLLPNYAILSTAFLREAVVCMFITLSVYCFLLWIYKKRNVYLLEAMLLVFPATYFHSGSIAVLVGYIVLLMIYDNNSRTIHIKANNAALAVLAFAFAAFFLSSRQGTFLGKFGTIDSLEDIANTYEGGRTSYTRYVGNSNNPLNIIIFTIPRIFFFLLSPLPWMWSSFGDIIAFLFSSVFYLVTIVRVLKYLKVKDGKNRFLVVVLFVIALGTTFVFAWGTSNGGTAARHRDKMVTLYGLLLALCSDQVADSRAPKRRKWSYTG